MPKHLAIDKNYLSGTVYFNGTKAGIIYFTDSQGNLVYFNKAPRIALTPNDQTTMPPFKQTWIKSGTQFIGVKIAFTQVWTGSVDWIVLEAV